MAYDKIDEQIARRHAREIRRALDSAETKFKSYFRKFCVTEVVKWDPTWQHRAIPQKEADAIVASFKDSLDKNGIDINTAKSIPYDTYRQIITAAQESWERTRAEEERQMAVKDLDELLKYDKPIIWADNISVLYGETYQSFYDGEGSAYSQYEWSPQKGASGRVYTNIKPMSAVGKLSHSREYDAYIPMTIEDVLTMSRNRQVFVASDAIFVTQEHGPYLFAMADKYRDYMKEHGMDIPILGGREGYDAILKCYEQRRIELSNEINLSNASIEEKYQMVSDLLKGMQATGSYIAICDNKDSPSVCIINEDGNYERVGFEEVQPGMNILCGGNEFKDMEAGDTLDDQSCFKVVHIIEIDNATVLVTDRGIVANRDIGKELGIEQEQEHEYTHEI